VKLSCALKKRVNYSAAATARREGHVEILPPVKQANREIVPTGHQRRGTTARILTMEVDMKIMAILIALVPLASWAVAIDNTSNSTAATTAVADPSRPDSDTTRDADRKPAQTLEFAGIKRGDKVADYVADAGYFTRLFASIVGSTGHVYAVEPTAFFKFDHFVKAAAEPQGYAVAHPTLRSRLPRRSKDSSSPRSSTCSGFPEITTTYTTSSWARSTSPRLTGPSTVR